MRALKHFFSPSPDRQQAHTLYAQIVAAARQPIFYREWAVPDTLDGRFDILALHMFLTLQACEKDKEFCRDLTEIFFTDMDRSLREIGVTDTGVGKRVKKMAQAFYGRLAAYTEAGTDEKKLKEALKRNVWREQSVAEEALASLAAYMRKNAEALRAKGESIIENGIHFSG